jgi:hypothetical protein
VTRPVLGLVQRRLPYFARNTSVHNEIDSIGTLKGKLQNAKTFWAVAQSCRQFSINCFQVNIKTGSVKPVNQENRNKKDRLQIDEQIKNEQAPHCHWSRDDAV